MTNTLSRWKLLFAVLSILLIAALPMTPDVQAQTNQDQICFDQTGFCISGPIRQFWERNGGLPVFGYPLSPQQETYVGLLTPSQVEVFAPGVRVQAQQFERNRLELHPDGSVKVGRLGADILAQQGRDWFFIFPRSTAQPGCEFFEATGHNICGEMLQTWRTSGGMELIGMPLSDPVEEMIEDGNTYIIQWFERARFQITPGVGVQLGRLGALDLCASIPPPVNTELSPSNCLIRGVGVTTRIYGFPPNSQVRTWAVLEGGIVVSPDDLGEEFIFTVDGEGSLVLPLGPVPYELGNRLYFIFQGEGDARAVFYLNVIDPELTPAMTSVFHPCFNLPPPGNGTAVPINDNFEVIGENTTCGVPGVESLGVKTGGFMAGEPVKVTFTAPNGTTNQANLVADNEGVALNNGNLPRFQVNAYRQVSGLYMVFFVGEWSKNIAVVPIMVTNVPLPYLPSPPTEATLRIINESPQTICYVNFSPTTESDWGPDRLDPTETIPSGGTRSFTVAPGEYDIRLLDCEGNQLLDQRNVPIYDLYELRFSGVGAAGMPGFNLAMRSKQVTLARAPK